MKWRSTRQARRLSTGGIAVLALAAVAGCASPNPKLYTLSIIPAASAGLRGPGVVSMREVSIARYLERPQIVRPTSSNQLDVQSNQWWGEPLGAMLTRVLVEELSQRLPNSTVYGENGAINSSPEVTIEVNIERLDAAGPQSVALIARTNLIVAGGKGRSLLRTVRLQVPAQTPSVEGEVAAMSVAVGQLADGIADQLHNIGPTS